MARPKTVRQALGGLGEIAPARVCEGGAALTRTRHEAAGGGVLPGTNGRSCTFLLPKRYLLLLRELERSSIRLRDSTSLRRRPGVRCGQVPPQRAQAVHMEHRGSGRGAGWRRGLRRQFGLLIVAVLRPVRGGAEGRDLYDPCQRRPRRSRPSAEL